MLHGTKKSERNSKNMIFQAQCLGYQLAIFTLATGCGVCEGGKGHPASAPWMRKGQVGA